VRIGLAAKAARSLEEGTFRSRLALGVSALWERSAGVVREVALPAGARVVGVGGATLGGSYKTPLVLALAKRLAARGNRVAVVSHGYKAGNAATRVVGASEPAVAAGDEAAWLARELAPLGVPVVVGARPAALALAAGLAPLVLVDSLLQTSPERLALSVLAVDARCPFGAGACPPAGDLRASPGVLLEASDVVAGVGAESAGPDVPPFPPAQPVFPVASSIAGVRTSSGRAISTAELGAMRLGLLVAVARPERILRALAAVGVHPVDVRFFGDHRAPSRAGRPASVGAWLTTAKCGTKLGNTYAGAPVFVLEHRLTLPEALIDAVAFAGARA
jgi:tetraacyldisaccharide 4'-kinase